MNRDNVVHFAFFLISIFFATFSWTMVIVEFSWWTVIDLPLALFWTGVAVFLVHYRRLTRVEKR